jgi:hypothetical protein
VINLTSDQLGQFARALRTTDINSVLKILFPFSTSVVAGASRTLTQEEDGLLFIATLAGTITFTLPGVKEGVQYEFLQTVDQNMVITGSANVLALGNAAATSVTYSTASEKIGAHCRLKCVNVNGTLKWVHRNLTRATATIS